MFRFANPEYLLFIIIVPFLVIYASKLENKIFIKYSVADLAIKDKKTYRFKELINALILILLILALANPQKRKSFSNYFAKGIDIVIALDTSGSMAALDFQKDKKTINRLNALKYVVKDFIEKRKNDKIGLIVFGKNAFTQCPLTIDHTTLEMFVDQLSIGMAGDSTAIGSALILGIKRLKNVKGKSKLIILVTDGRNNSGKIDPITAAKLAKELNIKIYTIGIGSKGKPVPIPQMTIFGYRTIYVNVDLDDYTLKQIAKITGGTYFNAADFNSLKKTIKEIDKIEKIKFKVHKYFEIIYLYYYFLLPALVLLIFKIFYFRGICQKIP